MAWTAPTTAVTNATITAALWNSDVRDNASALSTHTHTGAAGDGAQAIGTAAAPLRPLTEGCRVTNSGAQTVNSATVLAFDTETFDQGGLHDNSTNNSRITIPSTGVYMITFEAAVTVSNPTACYLRIDGTTQISISLTAAPIVINQIYKFTAAQYIEVVVNGSGSVFASQKFAAQRIG